MQRAGRLLDSLDARLAASGGTRATAPEILDACIVLLGADGGYLTVAAPGDVHAVVHASGATAEELADLEICYGEGPARAAFEGSDARTVTLGEASGRWPVYVAAADSLGAARLTAFPLRSPDRVLGVLVLFAETDRSLSVPDEVAQVLVDHAALTLVDTCDVPELIRDDEWADQAIVHRATGMVAAQLGVSPQSAVSVLRARGFVRGERLVEVARDVVERRLTLNP
ncbi:GAF and ANTAR domain-containing protein [Paraoerskovia marina]|uniref:GAF and ANTAR domain-containing protein n=1 Tax=Paraoerskovia marina TaxID=545619 RepID=UPI0004929744|nr:GAF and ANTAR domain-containing protein [Paraoerskovia marina]